MFILFIYFSIIKKYVCRLQYVKGFKNSFWYINWVEVKKKVMIGFLCVSVFLPPLQMLTWLYFWVSGHNVSRHRYQKASAEQTRWQHAPKMKKKMERHGRIYRRLTLQMNEQVSKFQKCVFRIQLQPVGRKQEWLQARWWWGRGFEPTVGREAHWQVQPTPSVFIDTALRSLPRCRRLYEHAALDF